MYYIKIPTVRFTDLVRSDPQGGMVFEGLKNLDEIRQNGWSSFDEERVRHAIQDKLKHV